MKHLSFILTLFTFSLNALAQSPSADQFNSPINTGANMTLGLNTSDLSDFIGDQIGAFNSDGLCIGLDIIQESFFTMALWGDDNGTPEVDGLFSDEIPSFAILTNAGFVIPIAEVGNFSGYTTNEFQVSNSLSLAGCTSDSYLEFHTQGYTAQVDNGSCTTPTYDLNISASMFESSLHTDNNMVIGLNASIINSFAGGSIGAFYDFNGDGILECVDVEEIPSADNGADGFFTISLWGDDQITEEIDGLQETQVPTFAILTASNHVLAFEFIPEFDGYSANAFPTYNEINFDLTIYGCMDATYCNYNPEAEEDDGSCEGLPGCTDDNYVEYDAAASCMLENSCETTWVDAYNQVSSELNTLNSEFEQLAADYDYQINTVQEEMANTVATYEAQLEEQNVQITSIQQELDNTISSYETQLEELNVQISSLTAPIAIDIVEGWNLIGYTLDTPQDAVASFENIEEHILIVKNNNADVYWPEFGFNGIGDLIPGQGYQIKVTQAIPAYQYLQVEDGFRVELTPTVPQWIIDMPTELHPNDVRTLVKVVNLLGQEVNPEEMPEGTTLIYLYNDATVEKKMK